MRPATHRIHLQTQSQLVVWAARIALVTMVMQITAVGHWNFGPFHSDNSPESFASHAAHCHGSISGCAGESSSVGTYLESPLSTVMPFATIALPVLVSVSPRGIIPGRIERPPRAT
ncbi:MAG TPA: hypothetical protein VH951_12790 [Dehalococcoidia bacterium]